MLLAAQIVAAWLLLAGSSQAAKRSLQDVDEPPVCGYDACQPTEPAKLNVHIVAHTHLELGKLKTADQYYFGTRKLDSPVEAQFIFDSVVAQLSADRSKRFVLAEVAYLWRWWRHQDEPTRAQVRQLVQEGRLEFVNGGWCTGDEASAGYHASLEQLTLGLKFLAETFGRCAHPKAAWQLDALGHTNEQASLFAQLGFDGLFVARLDERQLEARRLNRSLDLVWHADRALPGQAGSIATSLLPLGLDEPRAELCFDALCQADNIVEEAQSRAEANARWRLERFLRLVRQQASARLTNQLLLPVGGAFHFAAAERNFRNLDTMLRLARQHANATDLNLFYSTPACYLKALHQAAQEPPLALPERYHDFLPYYHASARKSAFATGSFSARPALKLLERQTLNLLQVARFVSMANLLRHHGAASDKRWLAKELAEHQARCLGPLWEVLSELQDHNALSGGQRQHVVDELVQRAHNATTSCARFLGDFRRARLVELAKKSERYEQLRESGKRLKLEPLFLDATMLCAQLNISQCDALESSVDARRYLAHNSSASAGHQAARPTRAAAAAPNAALTRDLPAELETRSVLLTIYNPLAHPLAQFEVRLPCNGRCETDKIKVLSLASGESMRLTRLPLQAGVVKLPFRAALTNHEILFYARLPALGYASFVLEDANDQEIVDDSSEPAESSSERSSSQEQTPKRAPHRGRWVRQAATAPPSGHRFAYFAMSDFGAPPPGGASRAKRQEQPPEGAAEAAQKVIVKFDKNSGTIVGLKRAGDGNLLNITQRFGYYFATQNSSAHLFSPNASEPYLLEQPVNYKIITRRENSLIEIHQKWADWLWQTIRIDARKNYIEFDYLVGPLPREQPLELVTRYMTSLANNGTFLTDSGGRQLMVRHRQRRNESAAADFYPVTASVLMKNTARNTSAGARCARCAAEWVAILVDRAQAAACPGEGQLELLLHRRHAALEQASEEEPLNEPGEDGRGLVVRGTHRLYAIFRDKAPSGGQPAALKSQLFRLPQTPRFNLDYEQAEHARELDNPDVDWLSAYLVQDQTLNELRRNVVNFALRPTLTFDRLRAGADELMEMLRGSDAESAPQQQVKVDLNLLNVSLPENVHLLTLQPWVWAPAGVAQTNARHNELLLRLENLDNPLTLQPFPDREASQSLLRAYKAGSELHELERDDGCQFELRPRTEINVEHLLMRARIVSLTELNLGANERAKLDKRLNWSGEGFARETCKQAGADAKPLSVQLMPREIRTFLARFEFI